MNEVLCDRLAVYGDHSRKLYLAKGCPEEQIIVTGNPDWDKYQHLNTLMNRQAVFTRLGLDPRKKTLLFASFWVTGPLAVDDPSLVETFYRKLLTAVRSLQERRPIQLAVKVHPAQWDRKTWFLKLALEEGLEDVLIENGCIEELLFACDALLCKGSNIAFEAFLLEKPVVSYRPIIGNTKGALIIDDNTDLEATIEQVIFDQELREKLLSEQKDVILHYTHLPDGRATSRILEALTQMTGIPITLPDDFIPILRTQAPSPHATEREDSLEEILARGDAAAARGERERASALYEQAAGLKPDAPAPQKRLAGLLLQDGRHREAVSRLNDLVRTHPTDAEPRLLLGMALCHLNDPIQALEHFHAVTDDMAEANDEQKEIAYFYSGRCRRLQNDPQAAEAAYQQALLLNPNSAQTPRELVDLYLEQHRWEEAEQILRLIMTRIPDDSRICITLSDVLCHQGRQEEGKALLAEALEARPDDADILYGLVSREAADGDHARALKRVETFLSLVPDSRKALLLIKKLMRQMPRHPDSP